MKSLAERQREKRLREVLEALKDPVLFSPGVDPSALRDVFGGDALGEPRPGLVGPITPFLVHPDERTRRYALKLYLLSASDAEVVASVEPDGGSKASDWADAASAALHGSAPGPRCRARREIALASASIRSAAILSNTLK